MGVCDRHLFVGLSPGTLCIVHRLVGLLYDCRNSESDREQITNDVTYHKLIFEYTSNATCFVRNSEDKNPGACEKE